MFELGGRPFAVPLPAVREIVRMAGVESLPGMTPPMIGVLDLRGYPLPVMDLRDEHASGRGDVLVLDGGANGDPLGVAVDRVLAVLDADGLQPSIGTDAGTPTTPLPSYVKNVLRNSRGPVYLVDVREMLLIAV
ncbi:MAG: purine-binding chemotaxis protein CheW [Frankiaceae bacterium]|nr:purine-binding chemotaxis protein CheW [Frankiaceae bacterium]